MEQPIGSVEQEVLRLRAELFKEMNRVGELEKAMWQYAEQFRASITACKESYDRLLVDFIARTNELDALKGNTSAK